MKYDKNEKKLTYEMKSVGDAWMDHVQKHHNTDAVTPVYLVQKEPEKRVSNNEKVQNRKPDLYKEAVNSKGSKERDTNVKDKDRDIERSK